MLESDPELVHFDEVGEHEADGILQVPTGATRLSSMYSLWKMRYDSPIAGTDREKVPRLPREVVSQEQPPRRMLYTPRHLQHILHNLLDRCIRR